MTRRVLSIEPAPAGQVSGQATGERAARPVLPNYAALKLVSSRTGTAAPPDGAAASERADADAWLKLPKGIAIGLLLALAFWAVLAVCLLW
jgi:hypothetical protein